MKRIVGSDVRGVRLRERPRMGWMDGMKKVLNEKGMSVQQGRMILFDRCEWKVVKCMNNDSILIILGGDSHATGLTLGSYQVQEGSGCE